LRSSQRPSLRNQLIQQLSRCPIVFPLRCHTSLRPKVGSYGSQTQNSLHALVTRRWDDYHRSTSKGDIWDTKRHKRKYVNCP
jgi:hypothetical protein